MDDDRWPRAKLALVAKVNESSANKLQQPTCVPGFELGLVVGRRPTALRNGTNVLRIVSVSRIAWLSVEGSDQSWSGIDQRIHCRLGKAYGTGNKFLGC